MKLLLTIFGVTLLTQSVLCAPVYDEELIEVNPQVRSILDMIIAAISRPFVSSLGQGIVDASTFISSALNGVGDTAGNTSNNDLGAENGIVPVYNDQPIPIEQNEDLLNVINALVDHINSEPPKVTPDVNENDELALLNDIVNEAVLNANNDGNVSDVNDVEEIPLYVVVF